jgi:hypothetical protein
MAVVMALTTKALDQVLSAVGMKFVPCDLNRDKLCKKLDWAETWFRTVTKLHTSNVKLHKKLNRTAKTAKLLTILLADNNDEAWREISQFYPLEAHDPKEIVDLLIKAVDKRLSPKLQKPALVQKASKRVARELALNERSAFEWLAGQYLPKIFKKHFRDKATARNGDGEPNTPYLRFATCALKELGINHHNGKPYSPESVVRAMTSASTGRKRRRS